MRSTMVMAFSALTLDRYCKSHVRGRMLRLTEAESLSTVTQHVSGGTGLPTPACYSLTRTHGFPESTSTPRRGGQGDAMVQGLGRSDLTTLFGEGGGCSKRGLIMIFSVFIRLGAEKNSLKI